MSAPASSLWPVAGISTVVMVLALSVAMTVRLPTLPRPVRSAPEAPPPAIWLSKIDSTRPDRISQEIELRDSVPLYLPTRLNTSVFDALPDNILREPGTTYRSYPPKYVYSETNLDLRFPDPEPVIAQVADVLTLGKTSEVFSDIGEKDISLKPLSERVACFEIVDVKTGNITYRQEISKAAGVGFPKGDWRPLEVLVNVDTFGPVGTPTIVAGEGSGSDEIDAFFCNFLAKRFLIGNHVRPGVYAVRIGP